MIKLFATDLDGTLLKENTYITDEDQQALHILNDHNVALAVATGRSDQEILEILRTTAQNGHRVSQNGAFVYSQENTCVHEQTFARDISRQLHKTIQQFDGDFLVSTAEHIYFEKKTTFLKRFEHLVMFPLKQAASMADDIGSTIIPSKFMLLGETIEIALIQQQLQDSFGEYIESYLSDSRCVDIVPKGVNKAVGISHLLNHIGINHEEIAVIGDSFNDIAMLKMSPHSYVMATADDAVKKHANKIVNHVHEAVADLKQQRLI